ncbi:MAG: phytanoyl-CoA dioxygenase family protein [Kiloniellales bacterium]|nr:phytanoyl-CoA dioxygenase family protein [Kiloniellales bacterium]
MSPNDAEDARAAAFARDGYCVWPGYLGAHGIETYRGLCDRVLAQWRAGRRDAEDVTNMAYLTDPAYWQDDRAGLIRLLDWLADPDLMALLGRIAGAPLLFHNTQYFAEPLSRTWDGIWHRDTQFLAWDDAREQAVMARVSSVHVHVAFVADDNLEVVPGSHARFDSAAERAVRKSPDKAARVQGTMPGARRIALAAGDAVIFDSWSIHRGRYVAGRPRRTFDAIYAWGEVWEEGVPPPTCFTDATLLAQLSAGARDLFGRFVGVYSPYWARGAYLGAPEKGAS